MSEALIKFLTRELEVRGWSQRELARRSGVTQTTISVVLSGQRDPTFDFVAAISKPLNQDPVEMFKLAGLLPGESQIIREARVHYSADDISLQELHDYIRHLTPDERLEVLRYIRFRRNERRRAAGSDRPGQPATDPD